MTCLAGFSCFHKMFLSKKDMFSRVSINNMTVLYDNIVCYILFEKSHKFSGNMKIKRNNKNIKKHFSLFTQLLGRRGNVFWILKWQKDAKRYKYEKKWINFLLPNTCEPNYQHNLILFLQRTSIRQIHPLQRQMETFFDPTIILPAKSFPEHHE